MSKGLTRHAWLARPCTPVNEKDCLLYNIDLKIVKAVLICTKDNLKYESGRKNVPRPMVKGQCFFTVMISLA